MAFRYEELLGSAPIPRECKEEGAVQRSYLLKQINYRILVVMRNEWSSERNTVNTTRTAYTITIGLVLAVYGRILIAIATCGLVLTIAGVFGRNFKRVFIRYKGSIILTIFTTITSKHYCPLLFVIAKSTVGYFRYYIHSSRNVWLTALLLYNGAR